MALVVPIHPEFTLAKGRCNFNVTGCVYGAFVNGVALFAFQSHLSKPESPFFSCVVSGHMTVGGGTLYKAMAEGVRRATEYGIEGSDHRISRKEFKALMEKADVS